MHVLGDICFLPKLESSALFQTNFRLSNVDNSCLEGRMSDISVYITPGFYSAYTTRDIEVIIWSYYYPFLPCTALLESAILQHQSTYARNKIQFMTSTVMRRIATFRSETHRMYDGGPIIL